MKVITFVAYYLPGYKGGGPTKTIKNLIDQTRHSISYEVIALDRDLGDDTAYSDIDFNNWNCVEGSKVFYTQPGLTGVMQILKVLCRNDYDIIYLNSFFSPKFSFFPLLVGKFLKQQIILGPRGEFSEGALSLKATKKNFFIKFYKVLGLSQEIVFQASSKYEAEDIKRVLGNDVDIVIAEDIGAQEFATNMPKRKQSMKAVFISRISPMKNLDLALEILKKVKGPLIYDIYGPIEDEAYWQQCQKTIKDLPSNITVQYKGELLPNQVITNLSSYDFFFMPTKGENYGHVIAEAICAGLPLVISDATPWKDLESLGIGWDLPLDNLDTFSKVIDQLIEMSDDQHYVMRQTVITWAKQRFAQSDAIEANIDMFHYAHNKKKGINNAV